MPLASFHYVFESQQELMQELIRKAISEAGDSRRFPELTEDIYFNVEQMLLSTFEWAVENPGEELAYFELGAYALRTPGMEHFGRLRVDHGIELIKRAFYIVHEISKERSVVDLQQLAFMILTIIEGNGLMLLNSGDPDMIRRCIKVYATFLVDYSIGRLAVAPSIEGIIAS